MYLFINDINKTDNLHRNSLSLSDELQQRVNSASFTLSGYKPDYFDDVKVYEAYPIFSYTIDSITLKKSYWEALGNNLFRVGNVIDVNVPNGVKKTIESISEDVKGYISNLVGSYEFNGNAIDQTGNGNTGTAFGNVTYGADSYGKYADINGNLDFTAGTGAQAGLYIGNKMNYSYLTDFSYSYTVSVITLPPNNRSGLFGSGFDCSTNLYTSGFMDIGVRSGGNISYITIPGFTWLGHLGEIHTVGFSYSASETKFYVYFDGVLKNPGGTLIGLATFLMNDWGISDSAILSGNQSSCRKKFYQAKVFGKILTVDEHLRLHQEGIGQRTEDNIKLTFTEDFTSLPTVGNIAGRKRFAGNIVDISDKNKALLGNVEFDVTALDHTRVFDKKLINDTFADRDARYIVNDFCNTTINRNIAIEDFGYANTTALRTKWTNNPTLNTSDYREGDGCMTFAYVPVGTGSTVATLTAINTSEIVGGRLAFWYNAINVTSIKIEFGSTSGNYVHTTFAPESGWVYWDKLLSEMTVVGAPNYASITHVKVEIVSTGSATIDIDGIRVLEGEFFRHYPHVQSSVVFDDFRINRVKPTETMQRLADSLEWYWFVDYDRNIWLFPNTTIIAPIEINETSNNFSNLSITHDTSRLINRQVVRGGEETSTAIYSQVVEGNSVAREWIMKNKFKNLVVKLNDGTSTDTMEVGTTTTNVKATAHGLVTGDYIVNRTRSNAVREIVRVDADNFTVSAITSQTNGDSFSLFVAQTVGVEGINVDTSYDYMSNYNEKSIRSAELEPTLTTGKFLLFQYNEVIPILVQRTDNTSMMLMKSVLGYTDGIFDGQPIVDQTITSRGEAIQVAEATVNKYSNVVITATFQTEQEGLEAGQFIRIKDTTSSDRNIDQDFIIQSVKCKQIEWGINRYYVTCSSLLFGMLELLQQLLANNSKIKVNEDEVINNIEDASEVIMIAETFDTNIDGEITAETMIIADSASTDIVEPPFFWGPTGLASEFQWQESVWS